MEIRSYHVLLLLLQFCLQFPLLSTAKPFNSCDLEHAEVQIQLDPERLLRFFHRGSEEIFFTNPQRCFVKDTIVKVYEVKPKAKDSYWKFLRGTAKVISVQNVTLQELKQRNVEEEELRTLSKRLIHIHRKKMNTDSKKGEIMAVLYRPEHWQIEEDLTDRPDHPRASKASVTDIKDASKQGALYDLRPPSVRKASPLPFAAQGVELNQVSFFAKELHSPEEVRAISGPAEKVKTPLQQPIYLISECPEEFLGYNAVTFFSERGFKKVIWFPEGAVALAGAPGCKPASDPKLIVTEQQLILEKSFKNKFVYVKKSGDDPVLIIPSSAILTMNQNEDELGVPTLRGDLTAEKIMAAHETLVGTETLNKEDPLILYGNDSYDWRPYKASLLLKAQGYHNVRWLRSGLYHRKDLSSFYPAKYPVMPLKK